MASEDWIRPIELQRLSGDEVLGPSTVLAFRRWGLGDLRMNNARGYVVEFLVAQSLAGPTPIRVEWGPYDAQATDGTRVEVKATGRLQSWTGGCPRSRRTLNGGPPASSAPVGSVRGANQVREDRRNRHEEGIRPEGRHDPGGD